MLRVALELVEVTEGVTVSDGTAELDWTIVLEGVAELDAAAELDSEGVTKVADGSSTGAEVVASTWVLSGVDSSLTGAS